MRLSYIFFLIFFISFNLLGQEWELQLENEKIKVYTKDGENDNIKAYKAISTINFPADEIYKVYIDFDNYNKWFEELDKIKLIDSSTTKSKDVYLYYSIIKFPFLFNDRDMITELSIDKSVKGKYILKSVPKKGEPENDDYVRLNKFYQNTELVQVNDSLTSITMEGKFDAGGSVPVWLMNMFVVNSPLNSVENMEKYLDEKLKLKTTKR